jgi:hypothetical protein
MRLPVGGGGGGTETVTVVVALTLPAGFVAVITYTVVCVGLTDFVVPVTMPTPWLITVEEAFEIFQFSVALCPLVILAGVAANELMVGFDAGGGGGGGGVEPLVTETLSSVSEPTAEIICVTVIETVPAGGVRVALNVPHVLPVAGASPTYA